MAFYSAERVKSLKEDLQEAEKAAEEAFDAMPEPAQIADMIPQDVSLYN